MIEVILPADNKVTPLGFSTTKVGIDISFKNITFTANSKKNK